MKTAGAREVATLSEGAFFGEMALFTGEPRTANIVAIEETEVLEIGHEAMKRVFDANPDLVESLSHIIAERRQGLGGQRQSCHCRPEPLRRNPVLHQEILRTKLALVASIDVSPQIWLEFPCVFGPSSRFDRIATHILLFRHAQNIKIWSKAFETFEQ